MSDDTALCAHTAFGVLGVPCARAQIALSDVGLPPRAPVLSRFESVRSQGGLGIVGSAAEPGGPAKPVNAWLTLCTSHTI